MSGGICAGLALQA